MNTMKLILILAALVSLVVIIISLAARWALFKKAGKPGWAAIVPFYSIYTEFEVSMGKTVLVWITLAAVAYSCMLSFTDPVANVENAQDYNTTKLIVNGILYLLNGIMYYNMGRAFGKSKVWSAFMFLFGAVMIIPMACDKNCKYIAPGGKILVSAVNGEE